MHFIVRVRIFLARHGWIRWSVVLIIAASVGWNSHQRAAGVERERASWGTTIDVIVARTDLEPGDPIDVDVRATPAAMVPTGALHDWPVNARLRRRVVGGQMITSADVATASGPAALAEPGTAVVGVLDQLARNASTGLAVLVTSEGITLAADATIVGADGEVVLVAVPRSDAPSVAAAAQMGTASLIFLP